MQIRSGAMSNVWANTRCLQQQFNQQPMPVCPAVVIFVVIEFHYSDRKKN